MTSLSNAVWTQIGIPIIIAIAYGVKGVSQGRGPNSTPQKTGGTAGSIEVETHGSQAIVVANSNFTKLDRGDNSVTIDDKYTHVYTQTSTKGLKFEVTRTYTGGMRPKKILGATDGGWRVVSIRPQAPMHLIQRALGETLNGTSLEDRVRRALPSSIEITSLT